VLTPVTTREWRKGKFFAFAGIGRPQKFFDSLIQVGATLTRARPFPDHHVFTPAEAEELIAAADLDGCRLVTTEKDMARLAGASGALAELRERTEVFAVTLEFDNPAAVEEMIAAAVRKAHLSGAGYGDWFSA